MKETKVKMPKGFLLQGDDWVALYVNGISVVQGHDFEDGGMSLDKYLEREGLKASEVYAAEVGPKDEADAAISGEYAYKMQDLRDLDYYLQDYKSPEEVLEPGAGYYLSMLKEIALDSDDGVLLKASGNTITAANELPRNVIYESSRTVRPYKYDYIEHAEINAIAKAARLGIATSGGTLYMGWFPCVECAKMIINAGITTVYCQPLNVNFEVEDKYKFKIARTLLLEAGVEIVPWALVDNKPTLI